MFSEITDTISFLVCVSLLFLVATTHKCVKQVEKKVDLVITEMNELDSDSDSSYSSDSSDSSSSSFDEYKFDPFIEKSSSIPIEFKNDFKFKYKRSMSF